MHYDVELALSDSRTTAAGAAVGTVTFLAMVFFGLWLAYLQVPWYFAVAMSFVGLAGLKISGALLAAEVVKYMRLRRALKRLNQGA